MPQPRLHEYKARGRHRQQNYKYSKIQTETGPTMANVRHPAFSATTTHTADCGLRLASPRFPIRIRLILPNFCFASRYRSASTYHLSSFEVMLFELLPYYSTIIL